jgi:hypothetical protein
MDGRDDGEHKPPSTRCSIFTTQHRSALGHLAAQSRRRGAVHARQAVAKIDTTLLPLNDPMVGGPAAQCSIILHSVTFIRGTMMESRALAWPARHCLRRPDANCPRRRRSSSATPEGDTTQRAALFRIAGCESLRFHVTIRQPCRSRCLCRGDVFPEGPLLVGASGCSSPDARQALDAGARRWCRNAFNDEVRWENIPIVADSVARPKARRARPR